MPEQTTELILASGSPRRKELLEEAGYRFSVVPPRGEELDDPAIPIRELTAINASRKAGEVMWNHPEAVVIAADTLVLLGDRTLGKPADRAEAREMLRQLNGRRHQVFTAVCVGTAGNGAGAREEFSVATEVEFKRLGEEELADYHARIDPMDKAGAYAAQEHGALIIERIEGSMSNVIGLPMEEVTAVLESVFCIRRG